MLYRNDFFFNLFRNLLIIKIKANDLYLAVTAGALGWVLSTEFAVKKKRKYSRELQMCSFVLNQYHFFIIFVGLLVKLFQAESINGSIMMLMTQMLLMIQNLPW